MFTFQPKRKIGGLSEELSSEPAAKNRPFVGSVSNSELIQLLSGSTPDDPDSPNTDSSQNTSRIPAGLKAKYEQLSGVSMDDVSVHYNSDKPIQYGALAYTQGNDVYLGPGQEQHLGHELGHVIQQKQGRVPVTGSVGGAPLNDDPLLEHEADSLLSSNSPVQHITAGHHPDSVAPIQRLRINLSGDKGEDPAIYQLQYYNIPTGGDRLSVPNGEKKEVKKAVSDYKGELKVNEDIVFEGHGLSLCWDDPVISLQNFFPEELADIAANIKKPDNWQGKIILFGCHAGDIAPQVAEEYYNITKRSVTVVGPKEQITVLVDPLDPTHPLFGFADPEKIYSDFHFQLLEKIVGIFQYTLWNNLMNLFHTLVDPLVNSKQKVLEVTKFIELHLLPSIEKINDIKNNPLNGFWDHHQNLKLNLEIFYNKLRLLSYKLFGLVDNISLSKTNDQMIRSQLYTLIDLFRQAEEPLLKIRDEAFQQLIPIFKSFLNFDDDKMMTSATYLPQEKDIDPPASKRSPQYGDDTKENHNSLISSKLFEIPK